MSYLSSEVSSLETGGGVGSFTNPTAAIISFVPRVCQDKQTNKNI